MDRNVLAARRGWPLALIALSLTLLLAGCFTSSQPKLPLAKAVAALGDGGRYVAYERQSDGNYKRDEVIDMRKRADGGYNYIDSKGKITPFSLYRIDLDLYIAQATREDGHNTDYLALRVIGKDVFTYTTDCAKQDAAKLKSLGVEITDQGRVCNIDNVANAIALFAGLNLGEPSGKMVRE